MRLDQYAALLEGSLRELLAIARAAETDANCIAPLDALEGSLERRWRESEAKARHLLTLKP